MKKTLYICVIVCITIFCIVLGTKKSIGGGWFPFTITLGDGGVNSNNQVSGNEPFTLTSKDDLKKIKINANVMEVQIVEGDSYDVSFDATKNMVPTVSLEGDTLVIQQSPKSKLIGTNNCELKITVPAGVTFEELIASINVGEVHFEGLSFEQTEITMNVGEIDISDSTLGKTLLKAQTGDIEVKDCFFTDMTAKSNVGNVVITSSNDLADYHMDLQTNVGEVELNKKDQSKKYSQDGSSYTIECSTNVGDVEIGWK